MNANRFDSITMLFASLRLSRRQTVVQAGVAIAAGSLSAAGLAAPTLAQESTPAAAAEDGPTMLFVQAFQSGGVAAKDGAEGRYILTLEQGLGHTVYFSDRPDRIVGSLPTSQFLAQLGFEVPPNAALVVETTTGKTDVVVLELFSPSYDEAMHTAVYEVAVLAAFERDNGFAETETDLAALLSEFGSAHLFIDALGCLHKLMVRCLPTHESLEWTGAGQCCQVGDGSNLTWSTCGVSGFDAAAWAAECNATYSACGGNCQPSGVACQTIC